MLCWQVRQGGQRETWWMRGCFELHYIESSRPSHFPCRLWEVGCCVLWLRPCVDPMYMIQVVQGHTRSPHALGVIALHA